MKILKIMRECAIYARYFVYRYFINGYFSRYKMYNGATVSKVFNVKESLFGYYNLSPENSKGEVIGSDITDDSSSKILIKTTSGVNCIGSTKAYNFQQGSMLQWDYLKDNILYYNTFNQEKDRYEAVVYDTNISKIINVIQRPICCVSKDGRYALSLNFERLSIMRPDYGYFCRKKITLPNLENDGIWKIDLLTKEEKLIISLETLKNLKYVESMDGANHKVNHIDIAPNGKRMMFLHRWVGPKGRFMRLITADENGHDIFILNGDKMTSHSCWYDDETILSFCNTPEFGNAYVSFVDKSNKRTKISSTLPIEDGHPSVSPDKKWIVTDCYPDLSRMSKIFLYNFENNKTIVLGRFYQPLNFRGTGRIDLHPKWNMNGDRLYFESGHNGYRNLYCVDLQSYINNQ